MKLLAALFAVFSLSACAPTNVTTTDGGLSQEQIRIVVEFFDWFYEPADVPRWGELAAEANKVARPARGETSYFIEVFNADPSPALLNALARKGATFLPGSRFTRGAGVRFHVDKIDFISPTSALVVGGHWFHEEGARWGTYELEKKANHWFVVKTIRELIS